MRRGIVTVSLGLAMILGGCGGSSKRGGDTTKLVATRPVGQGAAGAPTQSLVGRPQAATLRLATGRSTESFIITALPPRKYVWDVRTTAPASARIGVRIHTWYGVELGVLDPYQRDFCRVKEGQRACFMPFPLLEAQRAGRWTVIASKRSGAAAALRISITFHKP